MSFFECFIECFLQLFAPYSEGKDSGKGLHDIKQGNQIISIYRLESGALVASGRWLVEQTKIIHHNGTGFP